MILTLIFIFAGLSLVAIGGASSTLPAMEHALVVQRHLLSQTEFVRLFAIAQAAPGPNMLAVTLFGWRMAGLAGAAVATLAFLLPSCTLSYFVGDVWSRFKDRRWRTVVQAGLVPVTAGLMLAAGALLLRDAAVDWRAIAVATLVVAGTLGTRIHPLLFLGLSAFAGLVGFY